MLPLGLSGWIIVFSFLLAWPEAIYDSLTLTSFATMADFHGRTLVTGPIPTCLYIYTSF